MIKSRLGPEELLVPFTVNTLVEISLDAGIYRVDVDDTSWVEGDERKGVLVGTEVELPTDMDTFPTHASQVLSANLHFALDIVEGGLSSPVRKEAVLIIYHSFQQEIRRNDPGSAFAKTIVTYARSKLYKPAFAVKADTNYTQLVRDLGKAAAKSGEQHFIDTIPIVTRGTAGQLWLGNPHGDSTADVMARHTQSKQFVEPQAFNATLLELFGKELAIALYGCGFARDEDGEAVALELRIAVNARAVCAGRSTVYLNASKEGRSTVTYSKAMVVYRTDKIEVLGGNQVPVFDVRGPVPHCHYQLPRIFGPRHSALPPAFSLERALRSEVHTGADLLFLRMVSPDASRQHGG